MKTNQFIKNMRLNMPNDCRDFWEVLAYTPIKTVQKKHTVRNWMLAIVSVLTVAACALIVLNFNTIKNFFFASSSSSDTPVIITANEKDEFSGSDSSEEPSEQFDCISPFLKEAMETAPENVLFRTMVSDPSFYEYLNNYEQDGYKYIDFKKGTLKDQFEPDVYYTKMNELEYNARMDFFEYITEKYNIFDAEKPVDSSDYSIEEYHFIANLSREQINMLAEANCVLRLALPKSEANDKDVITGGLHSQLNDKFEAQDDDNKDVAFYENKITNELDTQLGVEGKIEVQIYLKIDTTSSAPTFNAEYYIDTIQLLTYEQLNESFISDYTDGFIKDYSLNIIKKESGLYVVPHQRNENGIVNLDYYGCSACVIAELSKDEIYEISKDKRVRVIAPNNYQEILGENAGDD